MNSIVNNINKKIVLYGVIKMNKTDRQYKIFYTKEIGWMCQVLEIDDLAGHKYMCEAKGDTPQEVLRKVLIKDSDKERNIINEFCDSIKEKYPDIKFKIEYDFYEDFWNIWHDSKDWLDNGFRSFTGGKIIKYFGDNDMFNTGFCYNREAFENNGDDFNENL